MSTYIMAEVGQAHDGSLGIAHSLIDALAATGVDAVKFQVHIAEAESSEYEKFRTQFSYQDASRMEYWKRIAFTKEEWAGLRKHCTACGLDFVASPFSIAAFELLRDIDVAKYKIGSGEITNQLLLSRVVEDRKPIIISSGMSCFSELDDTVSFLKSTKSDFSILQCTSMYPAPPGHWGLNLITEFRDRYRVPVGFSDHSGNIYACLAAASLGAEILEFHITFDQRMFGADATSSLTIAQTSLLVDGVRQIESALRNPCDKSYLTEFDSMKTNFGKSLTVRHHLDKGHYITIDDLETKKPAGYGLTPRNFREVIGKRLLRDMRQGDFVTEKDFSYA